MSFMVVPVSDNDPQPSLVLDAYGRPMERGSGGPQNASLENPAMSLTDPETWDGVGGYEPSSSGVRVTAKKAIGYPPLWKGVNLIARDVAKLPLPLYRRDEENGKIEAREHSSYPLLRKRTVPGIMKALTFKMTMQYHALMYGNGCAAIIRDGAGRAREMMILEPRETCLAIVNGVLWYKTKIGGEDIRLPARDVFHIKGLSHNGLWGLDVIEVMSNALGLGLAAREYAAKFYANGSNSSGLLMIPGHFTQEKIENTIRAWNKMQTGLTKSHRVALLQDNVKYQPLTIDAEKSQLLQTRQFEGKEVANILCIPPHKIGDDSKANYNSLEQENQSYLDESLDPWLCEWETEGDEKLLTEEEKANDSHFYEFKRDAKLRTDAATRSAYYKSLSEIGVLTVNDILRKENQPTIGPLGDKRYRPLNWKEISEDPEPRNQLPGPSAAARDALESLVADRLERMQRIETNKAAQQRSGLTEWVSPFLSDHAARMRDALAPVLDAIWAVYGRKDNASEHLDRFLEKYTNNRRIDLTEFVGAPITPSIQQLVRDLLAPLETKED